MRRVFLFMNTSLDGYIEAPGHDISWTHRDFEAFSADESQEVDTILLGHSTYEMMKSFWPTPEAQESIPEVAKFMNEKRKVVASHGAFEPRWNNVTVISDDIISQVKQLKAQSGKNIIILGSNNLCASLLPAGLIDELQIVVNPVVLGEGTSLFKGLRKHVELTLTGTRKFRSTIMLIYEPAER